MIEYAKQSLDQANWKYREMIYRDAAGVEKVNLIAAPAGQDLDKKAVELAFVCHTDTVPYAEDWPKALIPFVADGMLHGCGACDVKGFLACLLTSVIGRSKPMDGLRLFLTADEEIGCIGATHIVDSGLKPKRVVVGEPTSLHPARAGKGYCLAEITVFGTEAHSALPQKGRSAIYRAARLVGAIEQYSSLLAQEQHPFFSPSFTTLNIGTIQGGTAKNIVPGQCRFQLEWRPIPGQPAETVLSAMREIADSMARTDPDFRCQFKVIRKQNGFESDSNSELIRSIEEATGRQATSIPFGSEASLLAAVAEEVVVFGPGDMQTAHSSRECVSLAELDEAVNCLKLMGSG